MYAYFMSLLELAVTYLGAIQWTRLGNLNSTLPCRDGSEAWGPCQYNEV